MRLKGSWPMLKIYRILRNNKEQGPFTLEELTQLSLQPTDLVWQDGKSAAWRFPGEMESLQPFLPDPASHIKQVASPKPIEVISRDEETNIAEETLTAEKLERKAEEIYRRVQAYAQKNPDEIETKYARSLDDLKQEYADWLHKKKKRQPITIQPVLIAGASLLIILTVVWMFFVKGNSKDEIKISGVTTANPQVNTMIKEGPVQPHSVIGTSTVKKKERSSVDTFIDSVRRVLAQHEAERKRNPVVVYTPPSRKKVESRSSLDAEDSVTAPLDARSLTQMVDMKGRPIFSENGRNLEAVEVVIQNNSPQVLKTVSVDVFYYKKGEKFLDRSTLYFKDISPGNSYTLSLPANKKAVSARFRLGKVF